jgi:hypothetical protein
MTRSSATPAELIAAYRRGPALLRDAIAGMDDKALRTRPLAAKMSSLEVLCHVVDSDQFMCDRAKRTIGTSRPLLMGVESVRYLTPLNYHDRDPELDLRLLEVQREQLAGDLERLVPEAWQRRAVHSENGIQTLHEILQHAVEHLEDHVEAICTKRKAMGL